ncbi:DUF1292 domain-containing protein [Bacillus licheniformis]|uniref:DUF1292 domain-containing protein n=1 Tax=Bacillus licheniformis TaxID=1402 RepID=UPI00223B6E0E|nr:DUF1292 domain-containing protein [Bacillus licheniformis]
MTAISLNKSYVAFIIRLKAQDDEEIEYSMLQASYRMKAGEDGELMPIETEEEWDMIEETLNTFLADEDEEE